MLLHLASSRYVGARQHNSTKVTALARVGRWPVASWPSSLRHLLQTQLQFRSACLLYDVATRGRPQIAAFFMFGFDYFGHFTQSKATRQQRSSHAQHLSTHRPGLGRRQRRPRSLVQGQGAQVGPRGLLDEGDGQAHDREEVSRVSQKKQKENLRKEDGIDAVLGEMENEIKENYPRQLWQAPTYLSGGHRR